MTDNMINLSSLFQTHGLDQILHEDSLAFLHKCFCQFPTSSYMLLECKENKCSVTCDVSLNYQQSAVSFVDCEKLNPNWFRVSQFFKKWGIERGTPIDLYINDVWVEVDGVSNLSESTPILFFTLRNLPLSNVDSVIALAEYGFDRRFSSDTKNVIRKISHVMPDNAILSHIGQMNGRKGNPVRMNFKKLRLDQLDYVFTRLEIENSSSIIKSVEQFSRQSDSYTLTLDITEKIENRIGVEYFFIDHRKGYSKSGKFMSSLVRQKLLSKKSKFFFDQWTSIKPVDTLTTEIPIGYKLLSSFLYPEGLLTTWRFINHIKMLHTLDTTEAKVYLAMGNSFDKLV